MGLVDKVGDFFVGTTKAFKFTITFNESNPNITGDTVKLIIKRDKNDEDSEAILQKDADVATEGADGVAKFSLSKTDTDVSPGQYVMDIQWQRSNGEEYVIWKQEIELKKRVSDV